MFYLFLKNDLEALDKEISDILSKIRSLKKEKKLSVEQTSETWHDNFMFEDSARQINMYVNQLEDLIKLKENIKIVEQPKNKNKIGIGSIVIVKDENEKMKTFKIGSYMVFDKSDKNIISYKSPIANVLLKSKIGKIVKLKIKDKQKTFEILEIKN